MDKFECVNVPGVEGPCTVRLSWTILNIFRVQGRWGEVKWGPKRTSLNMLGGGAGAFTKGDWCWCPVHRRARALCRDLLSSVDRMTNRQTQMKTYSLPFRWQVVINHQTQRQWNHANKRKTMKIEWNLFAFRRITFKSYNLIQTMSSKSILQNNY